MSEHPEEVLQRARAIAHEHIAQQDYIPCDRARNRLKERHSDGCNDVVKLWLSGYDAGHIVGLRRGVGDAIRKLQDFAAIRLGGK